MSDRLKLLRGLLRRTSSASKSQKRTKRFIPALESLEPMCLPAQVFYQGPAAGDWGTAANWSNNAVPTINDDVVIPQGKSCVQTFNGSAKSVSIEARARLDVQGSLVVTNTVTTASEVNGFTGDLWIVTPGALFAASVTNNGGLVIDRGSVTADVTNNASMGVVKYGTIKGTFTNSGHRSFESAGDSLAVQGNFTRTISGQLSMLADATKGTTHIDVSPNGAAGGRASLDGRLDYNPFCDPGKNDLIPVTYQTHDEKKFNQGKLTWKIGQGKTEHLFNGVYQDTKLVLSVPKGALAPQDGVFRAIVGVGGEAVWLATLYDPGDPGLAASDYTVSIDWGDGITADPGTADGPTYDDGWAIYGGHTYSAVGSYTVTITVTDIFKDSWTTQVTFEVVSG